MIKNIEVTRKHNVEIIVKLDNWNHRLCVEDAIELARKLDDVLKNNVEVVREIVNGNHTRQTLNG